MTTILMILVAACSTAGGDTASTTALLAEPSTTSISTTAPSTTTTTEATTTTSEEECTERDGVLRNRRGFVCPPHMVASTEATGDVIGVIHLPGRYETRQFVPPLSFTRTDSFPSRGESSIELSFNFGSRIEMTAFGGEIGRQMTALPELVPVNRPADFTWAVNLSVEETDVDGVPATIQRYDVDCYDPESIASADFCQFSIEGIEVWAQIDGFRVAIVTVRHPDAPFTVVTEVPSHEFDEFWTETAQPILDSIEFLDS